MLTIRQPVVVKFILTEQTKQQLLNDLRGQVDRLSSEIDQLEKQGKAMLEDAMAQGGSQAQELRERLESEKQNRRQQIEQIVLQVQQIQQMELGTELQNMNVETTIDVRVGDDWTKVLRGSEIIVKDGIVHEIRRGGELL